MGLRQQGGCRIHNIKEDKDGAGPSWVGLYGKKRNFVNGPSVDANEDYLRESILNPEAKVVANDSGARYGVMNGGWDKLLTEKDIDSIIAFIKCFIY